MPAVIRGRRVLLARVDDEESERSLMIRIRVALATEGVTNWRNHMVASEHGRAGVAVGGSDILAVVPPFGRFLAIEVKTAHGKTDKRREAQQSRFLATVRRSGGVAGYAKSVEEALALVEEARKRP